MQFDVSIIIVNWNTRDILKVCLKSVYEQTKDISYEVIVVDNASSDDSVSMVKSEFPQLVLIENKKNRGFAAANNQGMKIAQGRYILLLNPDTIVLDGAIQKSLEVADRNLSIGIVGVRTEQVNGLLSCDCFQFASVLNLFISLLGLHKMFPKNRFCGRERLTWWDYNSMREVDVVAGCYMLVRQGAIKQVGGMDEGYFMYGEEMDWCWRFKKAGWKVLYYPYARIIHLGGVSSAQNAGAMRLEMQKSLLRFIEKRQGNIAKFIARAMIFVSGVIRLSIWLIIGLIGGNNVWVKSKIKIRQAITCMLGI